MTITLIQLFTKKLRCLVPEEDIQCFRTNNSNMDSGSKKLIYYQIQKKIYTKPESNGDNFKRKNPTKCPEKFGNAVTKSYTDREKVLQKPDHFKFNKKHFRTKQMKIGDIDPDVLKTPIRCSTPTPSMDSTILAGHLDYYADEGNYEKRKIKTDEQIMEKQKKIKTDEQIMEKQGERKRQMLQTHIAVNG